MDFKLNLSEFEKMIDDQTGSILFYKKNKKGIPDKIIHGDGFTVEIKNNEIYLIDIFNPMKLINLMLENIDNYEFA